MIPQVSKWANLQSLWGRLQPAADFSPPRELLALILFALARTAFCAYRAATQSLTSDEAFSHDNFISGDWSRLYGHYDANNHVLYSILAKLSIRAFGTSEFTLRLPSVVAGFFLVLGIACVLDAAGCARVVRWTALVALSLHPLMLDFSTAARGYGISLALLIWAIYYFQRGRDIVSGVLLGLSISANLTILYPAVGLILCPFLLRHGDSEKRIQSCLTIAFTAIGVFGAICYSTLSKADTANFYVGVGNLRLAVLGLIVTSLRGSPRLGLLRFYGNLGWIQFLVLPLLAIFLVLASIGIFRGGFPDKRPGLAPVVMLLTACVEVLAARQFMAIPYPVDRLGLYLVLLFGLSWAIGASVLKSPWVALPNAILAGLLVIQFATQLQTRYFQIWRYDLPAKDIARRLLDETRNKPPNSVKVSATWWEQPALEFYRNYYHISALQPLHRYDTTALAGFDYYVIQVTEDKTVRPKDVQHLHTLLYEPVSGVVLAKEP